MRTFRNLIVIILAILGGAGCAGGGAQVSIDRGSGTPQGTQGGIQDFSYATEDVNVQGSGAGVSKSSRYKAYGNTTHVDARIVRNSRYRVENPVMQMARSHLENLQ